MRVLKFNNIISLAKYSILIFIVLILIFILAGKGYALKGINQSTLGEGWLMVYNYNKINSSFRIDFGYGLLILSIIVGMVLEKSIKYIRKRGFK